MPSSRTLPRKDERHRALAESGSIGQLRQATRGDDHRGRVDDPYGPADDGNRRTPLNDTVLDLSSPLRGDTRSWPSTSSAAWRWPWPIAVPASRTKPPRRWAWWAWPTCSQRSSVASTRKTTLQCSRRAPTRWSATWPTAPTPPSSCTRWDSVGLRHNFVSSSDALNYRPQYWQLRTKNGTVGHLPGLATRTVRTAWGRATSTP